MPELQLITAKKDIFFVTTAPEILAKDLSLKGLQINEIASSRKSSQEDIEEPMNEDSNTLFPQPCEISPTSPSMQRVKSLQKTKGIYEEKKLIVKSNSCGDPSYSSEGHCENLEVPPNTPKPAVSPTRRSSNARYRSLFQQETPPNSNDSPERSKPLRVYRIPLVNLAGNHSHFHMHTSKIKPILKLVNNKIEEDNLENLSNTEVILDNKMCNDVTKKLTIVEKNPIDKITCNCANVSLFTS